MSKKFKLTIVVETTADFNSEGFIIEDSDVVDGFTLTRTSYESCITECFFLMNAHIENIEEIKI